MISHPKYFMHYLKRYSIQSTESITNLWKLSDSSFARDTNKGFCLLKHAFVLLAIFQMTEFLLEEFNKKMASKENGGMSDDRPSLYNPRLPLTSQSLHSVPIPSSCHAGQWVCAKCYSLSTLCFPGKTRWTSTVVTVWIACIHFLQIMEIYKAAMKHMHPFNKR